MTTQAEIETKFWKHLKSDRTFMLGIESKLAPRPMTAQFDGEAEGGPIYVFTARNNAIVENIGSDARLFGTFASKGHDIFANMYGTVTIDNDRARIERLWNPFVAAWFKGGKDDPELVLLRLDLDEAEIWVDASSIVAGIKMLLGADPKKDYADKVAKVEF